MLIRKPALCKADVIDGECQKPATVEDLLKPDMLWNILAPDEYGLHANVNPKVDHPRWVQAREQRIGEGSRRETLPFNGYADQAASLYAGMDLRKNF